MNEIPVIVKAAVILLFGAGFVAGKFDLDDRIREALERQQLRVMQRSAKTLADELEGRKLLTVKAVDAR